MGNYVWVCLLQSFKIEDYSYVVLRIMHLKGRDFFFKLNICFRGRVRKFLYKWFTPEKLFFIGYY